VIIETVQNPIQGLTSAKRLLYKHVDRKTALFLSGGSTPKQLYVSLAQEEKLNPGAVALVDERYGPPFHSNSNESMIKETGLIDYLTSQKIPFYGILQGSHRHSGKRSASRISMVQRDSGQAVRRPELTAEWARMTLENVAEDYDKKVKQLLSHFSKHIAILGIGEDGHIAGLPAKYQISTHSTSSGLMLSEVEASNLKSQKYVTEIRDFPGELKQRITLTFKALSQMDLLIVLVFGSEKQSALNLMLTLGLEEEIPSRFFKRPDIAKKTILITDQKVYNNY